MGTTTEQTQPRDLVEGQRVSLNSGAIVGRVEKVDKKGGRLAIAVDEGDDAGRTCRIKFRDVTEAEVLGAPNEPTEADLRAEYDRLQEKGKSRGGWNAAEAQRFGVLRSALGLDQDPDQPKAKKAATSSKGGGKRPKYPTEITDAVRRAKQIRGTTHGAPGAKQHQAVRAAIRKTIAAEGAVDLTADGILAFLGMTEKALKDAASGAMPTEKLRQQDGLRKVQALDDLQDPKIRPWVGGRNGASILAAWVEQTKEG